MKYYQEVARACNLFKIYNYCCAFCGGMARQKPSKYHQPLWLTVDHVQTQNEGGSCSIENLQILCNRCNSIKNRWGLPKLDPRQPQFDVEMVAAAQDKLQYKIMPARRKSGWTYISRIQLGY